MIDPNKLTEKTQEALFAAQRSASDGGRSQVDVEDLALALLTQAGGVAPSVLESVGANVAQLRESLESEIARQPRVAGNV